MVDEAKAKNKNNLMRLFVTSSLSFGEFIEFMRMMINEVDERLFKEYIASRYEEPRTPEEKILLAYMCRLKSIPLDRYQLPLEIRDPKSVCMLV